MNIADVWKIVDAPENFVCDMFEYIIDKCEGGANIAALIPQERVFFAVQSLEVKVNNGGFSQYFGNFSGKLCQKIISAFTAIGARRTAAICQKALGAYGMEISAD